MGQLVIPSGSKVYVDTAVLIYTLEVNTDYFSLLKPLWIKFQTQEIELVSSELILMEVLVLPLRTGKRKAYVLVGGKHRFFPKRELETIEYSIEDTYQGLYQQLRSREASAGATHIGKPRKKQLRNLLQNELSYARYGLWNFVIKEKQNKEPYLTLQRAGSNLRGLIRVL